jgi:hypothetical protein
MLFLYAYGDFRPHISHVTSLYSIGDSAGFFAGMITALVIWSILCAYAATALREHAAINQGGNAETWLDDIENCKNAVSVIGTLFVFILVFRFNACYDRWWESRIFWGDIISSSLDLGMMNRRWLEDDDLMDKCSRFIVVFSYACKSLLRGKSLKDEGEDGPSLVKKGLLTQKELDLMHEYPSWQPYFCLDMIREVILQAHKTVFDLTKTTKSMANCFVASITLSKNLTSSLETVFVFELVDYLLPTMQSQ